MSLVVLSARITYAGPDRLDVTRKSGREGLFLAPSWAILKPALNGLKRADEIRGEQQARLVAGHDDDLAWGIREEADMVRDDAWDTYTNAFLAEMRDSYKAHRDAWTDLLCRDRVVLCCYCTDPQQCHRYLLRTRILPALGAVDGGEIS